MAVRPAPLGRTAPVAGRPLSLSGFLEREGVWSWLMLAPGVLFLLAFVAYPFFYGIFLSLQDRPVAKPGVFIGLGNFVTLAHDPVFWQVARNMFVYTIVTTILKLGGGLVMALVMDQHFHGRNLVRAFLLLPFIVPTALSTIAWMWIFDPTFSVVNWVLVNGGILSEGPLVAGQRDARDGLDHHRQHLARHAILRDHAARGPPDDLAGAVRGRGDRRREHPPALLVRDDAAIKPVLVIVTMFSVIFTFSDFQLIYALTHGGPANATQVFATYAFDLGMSGGQLGLGAAVALSMLPALALLIVVLTLYLRRE